MKFGKTFPNHQVPEWSHQYVHYKNLKKLIKEITAVQDQLYKQKWSQSNEGGAPVKSRNSTDAEENFLEVPEVKKRLATFFFALDRDIENVNDFYNTQFLEYDRRLRRLLTSAQLADLDAAAQAKRDYSHLRPQAAPIAPDFAEDYTEILGVLIELRSDFRNLKWYAELNKRAFTKILKKLDKKVGTKLQQPYLESRIWPLGISNDTEVSEKLGVINSTLGKISPSIDELQEGPDHEFEGSYAEVGSKDISSPVNVVLQMIEKDDGRSLINELVSMYRSVVFIPKRTLIALLNKAALSQSFQCIDEILEIIPTLGDHSDISGRNFFHHHVIALGKSSKQRKNRESTQDAKNETGDDDTDTPLLAALNVEAAAVPGHNTRLVKAYGPDGVNSNDSPVSLLYILNRLPPHLRSSLLQRDTYKRTPLHYSAQYGLFEVSKIIIESLKEWAAWDAAVPIDSIERWGDSEGFTPMHLAVIGVHPRTVKALTSYGAPSTSLNSPRLLHLATKLNSPELIEALLTIKGFDVDYTEPETHETALYTAAKLNLRESAAHLLKSGANTEIRECNFGWTPIFAAATEGYYDIAKMLADHGAQYNIFDESGWTPTEHAVLRGHLDVANLLKVDSSVVMRPKLSAKFDREEKVETLESSKKTEVSSTSSPAPERPSQSLYKLSTGSESFISSSSDIEKKTSKHALLKSSLGPSHRKNNGSSKSSHSPPPLPKSFGHSYLQKDQSVVLIRLGGGDSKEKPAVLFNKVPLSKVSSTKLDTALSLVITCPDDTNNKPAVLDLPLDDILDPIHFTIPFKPDSSHALYFDIVPTYGYHAMKIANSSTDLKLKEIHELDGRSASESRDLHSKLGDATEDSQKTKILGRAVALLDKKTMSVGPNRSSLSDSRTVPIIENDTLDVLGTINFEFMIVKPFSHPNVSLGRGETYWKSLVSTRVIGHRGLGKNMNKNNSLQLGENTVESFIAAASLGASYIEFDVQLTKDDIPVIYHDFLVAESGADIPMHALTLEQFLDLNNADKHHRRLDQDLSRRRSMDDSDAAFIQRAIHMRGENGAGIEKTAGEKSSLLGKLFEDRMRLTRTFKKNNFKGNTRGHSIASSFVTLKELFKKIPLNVGFNVECKYPMLDEAIEDDIGHITVELNHWCDTVLQVVYDNANGRDIIFSSFHPDVCIMLSLKQPSFPILFLTEGGTKKTVDPRAASLQNAIRFARTWNLLGIVSAAKPVIMAPRLAQVIKSSGLVCVTYGVDNNDPEVAKIEMDAGVDAVIVDSVLAVRRGLTKYSSAEA
ncbi:Glycerophosphodiester phosphodiesterase GDE1 [Lachancea thermotolerans]